MRYAVLLALLWTTTSQAASLVIASDPERFGGRASVPKVLAQELRRAGAGPAPQIEMGLGYVVREVKVTSVKCDSRSATDGQVASLQCTFKLPVSEKVHTLSEPEAIYEALSSLSEGAETLGLRSCDNAGNCRLTVSAIYCLTNSRMEDSEKGKYVCSVIGA